MSGLNSEEANLARSDADGGDIELAQILSSPLRDDPNSTEEAAMKRFLMQNALRACVAATFLTMPLLAQSYPDSQARQQHYESERAKGVAAVEVGGEAVAARSIDLNGATGGWEVLVRMAAGSKGWKVVVDRDTWTVRSKTQIPNP